MITSTPSMNICAGNLPFCNPAATLFLCLDSKKKNSGTKVIEILQGFQYVMPIVVTGFIRVYFTIALPVVGIITSKILCH